MQKSEADERSSCRLGPGECVWFGTNHEKAAVICTRVHFAPNSRFEQAVDWSTTDENETDFANVQKGSSADEVSLDSNFCCFHGGSHD